MTAVFAHQPVLVLDVDYRPLRVAHWHTAVADFCLGKVEVVEYSRDRTIQGVNRTYPFPSVVRTVKRFKRDRIKIRFSRLNIYARDSFTCQFCGIQSPAEDLTFDHVLPRSMGGKTTWENIVTCCVPCNQTKANRTPHAAGMTLRRTPKRPHHVPAVTVRYDGSRMPEEWKPYWGAELEP